MIVVLCYLKRENYKDLKFRLNDSSYFESSSYFVSFPLRISLVNVTKSAGRCGFDPIY